MLLLAHYNFGKIKIKKEGVEEDMETMNLITQLFMMEDYAKDLLFNSTTDIQVASARSFLSRITEKLKKLYISTAIDNA